MFEAPAILSFVCDAFSIVVYFQNPSLFGESSHKSVLDINPLRSVFTLVIVAGLRIVAFVPYVWQYQHDRHLVLAQVPYLWHAFNLLLIAVKAIWEVSHKTWDVFLWVMLLGSAISVLCQAICLNHLVSTALPERRINLGSSPVSPHDDKEILCSPGGDSNEYLLGGSRPSLTDSFIHSIRTSLLEARTEWSIKIDKLKDSIVELARASGGAFEQSGEGVVFEEILVLFTQSADHNNRRNGPSTPTQPQVDTDSFQHDTISNIVRLHGSFPDAVEFYIPQLVVYLLYGSFETTSRLRSAMLGMCGESVCFAHRMQWFIEAFCLSEAGVNEGGVIVLQQLLKQIEEKGMQSAERISTLRVVGTERSVDTRVISTSSSSSPSVSAGYVSPTLPLHHTSASPESNDIEAAAAVTGSTVPDPAVVNPYLQFPLELCRPPPEGYNLFSVNVLFWAKLSDLSRDLVQFSRESRTEELKARLPQITADFLPSSTIYAPVGNVHHRIWNIHAEESFAFSTKERAPMFVCLEVVDSFRPQREKRKSKRDVLPAWVQDISTSIRRTFTAGDLGEEDDVDLDVVEDENDVELGDAGDGIAEHEELFDKKEMNRRRSTGSLYHSMASHDVGQWDEASPLRPRMRQSLDRSSAGSLQSHQIQSARARSDELTGKTSPFSTKPTRFSDEERPSSRDNSGDVDNDPEADHHSYQPIIVFKERWKDKERRLRAKSGVGNLPGYRLLPVIVKSNDDLRQEECAGQLVFQMHQILLEGGVDCWLRPYGIIAMSPDCGLIEAIPDTVSMDVLRRRSSRYTNLKNFFESFFGEEDSRLFEIARENFIKSLGAYCIVCYLLQLKDRHNGNILLDRKGHLIHIDFGFILGLTPGGNAGFESAPFKLTAEMVDLMGGVHSASFHRFREVCVETYMELRKHHYRIVLLLEMFSVGNEHLPFFMGHPQRTVDELRQRFKPDIHDQAAIQHVHSMIDLATDNWTTTCYDRYQRCCVGVF